MICVIGRLVNKELGFRHFSLPRARGQRKPKRSQNSASAFQIEIKEAKRLATSTVSIRQALELLAWL
jgi:hypothetical protein